MVSSSIRLTAWCKIEEAGGTVRDDALSRVTAIISALVICIIVCLSRIFNHAIDNAITYKAQRDKNARELKLANAAITDMQMRQRDDTSALDAKYTKELADAKAENDALRDDVAAGVRRRLHKKQSVSRCVKPPPPPAWIMQLLTGRHPLVRFFTLEGADHYAKTTGRNPSILMSSADRVAHIDGQLSLVCEQYTRASSGYKCLK